MKTRTSIGCAVALVVGACNEAPPPPATPSAAALPPAASTATSPSAASAASAPSAATSSAPPAPPELVAKAVALPGATGPVSIDLVAYDRDRGRVWVPVGDTGSVDVYEIASGAFQRVDGFKTAEREMRGKKRTMGPSAAAIGDGFGYVADRAKNEVCAVDAKTLTLGKCLALPTPADFVTYVAQTKEVWVTTPKDQSITVLDASAPAALKSKAVFKTPGEAEGAAVDADHGLYYTNFEDKNQTSAFDVKTHAIKSTWSAGCPDAPHGLAVDPARGFVIVACSGVVRVLDPAHDGATLATLDPGDGVDDISYDASKGLLYVAASKARRLTIARLGDKGQPTVVATGATGERARNAVADTAGNVYVPDSAGARLLVFAAPK